MSSHSAYLPAVCLHTHLPAVCLPACVLPACLLTCLLFACLPACLPASLSAYVLPACLPAHLPACLAAIGQGRWRPQVIGDFTESEARDFLFQQLGGVSSNDGKSIDKDDKAWAAVYEVCTKLLWQFVLLLHHKRTDEIWFCCGRCVVAMLAHWPVWQKIFEKVRE